jgi:Protein of unknown function (DUF3592)
MSNIPFILVLGLCAAITGYAGWLFLNGRRSRTWPHVEGTITTSRIDTVSSGRRGATAIFILAYSYVVSGQEYIGHRVGFGPPGWFSIGRPGDLHTKYPAGAKTSVYYDPSDPTSCALLSGAPERMWSFYAIAAMFGVIGLAMLLSLLMH